VGAGVGLVSLALALRLPRAHFSAVELQPTLCELARRNTLTNRMAERVEVVEADLRQLQGRLPRAAFDRVVSNPPFHRTGEGRVSPAANRAAARHELSCSLADVVATARHLLAPRGSVALIAPAERLAELCALLAAHALTLQRLRCVHPKPGTPAQRVLVQAVRGGRSPLCIQPPLFVRDSDGTYSIEARRILGEDLA
jgi:tRNA1Val (adenine37-N6)-methyltransferase